MINVLYFYISPLWSMCALPNMAVFCSSLISWIPVMLLRYFLNDFEVVPVAPIITGITFVFTFHTDCISIVRCLHFRIFSASFLTTFLFPVVTTSISVHVPISLSQIMMYGLLLRMVLSVCTCPFNYMVVIIITVVLCVIIYYHYAGIYSYVPETNHVSSQDFSSSNY